MVDSRHRPLEGHAARLVYRTDHGRLILVHTVVPPELEGRAAVQRSSGRPWLGQRTRD